MSNPNNLFDKVDGVESKVENVSTKVDALTKKVELLSTVQRTASNPRKAENPQLDLRRFIANGKREYCWMGTENEFQKEKKTILISIIVLIGVLIIASVFTSIACGLYTTFTLFEHIWLICICFIIKYISKSDRYYKDTELALNSCFETNLSADGIYEIGQLKKRYKVFLGLSCVCSILNIVYAWMENKSGMAIWTTFFELAGIGLSIFVLWKTVDFFCGYSNLKFTGINERDGRLISIYYSPILKKWYNEEEYFKVFSWYK